MIESHEWTDRVRKPAELKSSPQWWFGNDDDPVPPAWYHPEWGEKRRWFIWHYVRNLLHNFAFYVIGMQDRNFRAVGSAPIFETDAADSGKTGWRWCVIQPGKEVPFPLPYVSFTSRLFSFHLGWMVTGAFAARFIPKPKVAPPSVS